jgi:hypothetical protein
LSTTLQGQPQLGGIRRARNHHHDAWYTCRWPCWSEFIKDFGIGFLRRDAGAGTRSPRRRFISDDEGRGREEGFRSCGIRERKTNRRVPSVYHGLSGTKRERLISNGFLHFGMVHEFIENRTRIPLKSLAIPAGFEPATHGVEIRYLDRCRIPYRYLPAFKPFAKLQSTALRLSPLAPSSSVREALKITIALQRADIPALST